MNTVLFFSIQFIICAQCLAGIRVMEPDDPNRDPKWEWYHNNKVKLFSSINGSSVTKHEARLPFYTPGTILNSHSQVDAYPEDGWILVHCDFGTEKEAQPFPFFTLYNRYRGTFRVMLFNAVNREGSYFIGELGFLDGEKFPAARAGLFTFADTAADRCFLRTYNPNLKLTAISRICAFGSWAVFDFPLVGYDPSTKAKDPILVFKLSSVQRQELSLKSKGNLRLMQVMELDDQVQPSHLSNQSISGVQAILKVGIEGYNAYRSVKSFVDNEIVSKEGQGKNKDAAWFSAAAALASGGGAAYGPYLQLMGAVLNSFIGGANFASSWEPLCFAGQFSFDTEGTIETRNELWCHNLFINTGPDDNRAQRPVQEVEWGIFNFRSVPTSNWFWSSSVNLTAPPDILINPNSGLVHTSTRVAFIQSGAPGPGENPISTQFMTVEEAMVNRKYKQRHLGDSARAALWELKFKTTSPTKFSDNKIIIYKKTGIMATDYIQKYEETIKLPELK